MNWPTILISLLLATLLALAIRRIVKHGTCECANCSNQNFCSGPCPAHNSSTDKTGGSEP